jgi:hypothetical protein
MTLSSTPTTNPTPEQNKTSPGAASAYRTEAEKKADAEKALPQNAPAKA